MSGSIGNDVATKLFDYYQMKNEQLSVLKEEISNKVNLYLVVNTILFAAFIQLFVSMNSSDFLINSINSSTISIFHYPRIYMFILELTIPLFSLLLTFYVLASGEKLYRAISILSSAIEYIEANDQFWFPGKDEVLEGKVWMNEVKTITQILNTKSNALINIIASDYYYLDVCFIIGLLWSIGIFIVLNDVYDKMLSLRLGEYKDIALILIGIISLGALLLLGYLRSNISKRLKSVDVETENNMRVIIQKVLAKRP